jgi:TATA-box binding protein (TBP) (component of TFIID and TFIIIB)
MNNKQNKQFEYPYRDIEHYIKEYIITSINNPNAKQLKFKDVRKISIGISNKDIIKYRCKEKKGFDHCFVIIIRLKIKDNFKEFHIKIFNTGKLEIPGIQNEESLTEIVDFVINILQPFVNYKKLEYIPNTDETILINSNFNCGFYINREILHKILKQKYNIQSIYDPCSYPGIQSKFYYNPDIIEQNGWQIPEDKKHLYTNVKKISFMIFRTGSILISGKCEKYVLINIYEYLKKIFISEYYKIYQPHIKETIIKNKPKMRKKQIIMNLHP